VPRKPQRQRPSAAPVPERGHPVSRRRLPLAAGAAVLVVAVAAFFAWRRATHTDRFPAFVRTPDQNVLLVTIDTLRADALGSGGGRAATPNLDRLARAGIRFTFAHAQSVVTLVSHANILTGQYPFQHGVRDNAGFRLATGSTTLATLLHARGMAAGAFLGAFPLNRQFGLAQGFDVYDDVSARDSLSADFLLPERRAADVVAPATAWIAQQQKPWLAWVHVFDPHAPYTPPPPFDAQYRDNPYAGEVAYVDTAIAPLLDLARRQSRPTVIIVTGDHGEALGDHGERTHGLFAYESTLHVPLLLAQVGGGVTEHEGGVTSDVAVRHVDILPTILDLLGSGPAANLAGRTLLTAANGEREPRPSYFEAMTAMLKRGWAPLSGIVAGGHKYINLPLDEIYDLRADPREQKNLVASARDRVRTMTSELQRLHPSLPGEQTHESSEVRETLESLGYVSGSAPRKANYTDADDPKTLIEIDGLMMDGIELHRTGRTDEAIAAYRTVIQRRPDMGLAYRRLAYLLWEQGRIGDAIATLRHALATNGPDVDVDARLGTYLAETGNVTEAIPMLERAVQAEPRNSDALNGLGIAYARAGRHADAMKTFDRILAQSPRDAYALENIGTVQLQRGDLTGARDAFTKVLASDPRSSRAHAGLGAVALQSGDRERAFAEWTQAVKADPRNFDALYNLASELLRAGRRDEARPFVEQFVTTAPPAMYGPDIERLKSARR
jgi:arylsulfatase A-like enzyme/tetratricopeptide (TPR) repeat protein